MSFTQSSTRRDLTPRLTSQKTKQIAPQATISHSTKSMSRVSQHLGPSNEVFYNVNGAQPPSTERFVTQSQVTYRNTSPNDLKAVTTRYGKGATKRLDTSLSGILGGDQKDRAQRRADV